MWQANTDSIIATNVNLGSIETQGIDFSIEYEFDVADMGSVSITNVGNYVTKFDLIELPVDPATDCAGVWGGACDSPTAEFKNNLRGNLVYAMGCEHF